MHPSGNGTANGLKIYHNIVGPNVKTANSEYFWNNRHRRLSKQAPRGAAPGI